MATLHDLFTRKVDDGSVALSSLCTYLIADTPDAILLGEYLLVNKEEKKLLNKIGGINNELRDVYVLISTSMAFYMSLNVLMAIV